VSEPLAPTPFTDFSGAFDAARYVPVPDDWSVAVSDVVSSTTAIKEGRYKDVNLAGAATIAGIANATGRDDLPFAFGGDGAVVLIPPEFRDTAANAMRATTRLIRDVMGLNLRGSMIPLAEIRKRGRDVRIAAHDLGAGRTLAMLAGGGTGIAETLCKSADGACFTLGDESSGEADLTGLSCRWEPLTPAHGAIMALVVHARTDGNANDIVPAIYRDIHARIAAITGATSSPAHAGAYRLKWPPGGMAREAELQDTSPNGNTRARILMEAALSKLSRFTGWKPGGFDARAYEASLPAHSDYRKYADSLRMVIDLTPAQAESIRALLEAEWKKGAIDYGTHIADAALMTCFVRSTDDSGHIHFIDGADGGYALAAAEMKRRMAGGA
jgi:hypothetical protein